VKIEFRQYDGKGNPDDPKTGTPMTANLESIYALIRGKTVDGLSGVTADTENIQISFSGGPMLWFVTTKGRPRILFQR
jgi:hypothetical protein